MQFHFTRDAGIIFEINNILGSLAHLRAFGIESLGLILVRLMSQSGFSLPVSFAYLMNEVPFYVCKTPKKSF